MNGDPQLSSSGSPHLGCGKKGDGWKDRLKLPVAPEQGQGCGHVPGEEGVNYLSCPCAPLLLHPMLRMNSHVSISLRLGSKSLSSPERAECLGGWEF